MQRAIIDRGRKKEKEIESEATLKQEVQNVPNSTVRCPGGRFTPTLCEYSIFLARQYASGLNRILRDPCCAPCYNKQNNIAHTV